MGDGNTIRCVTEWDALPSTVAVGLLVLHLGNASQRLEVTDKANTLGDTGTGKTSPLPPRGAPSRLSHGAYAVGTCQLTALSVRPGTLRHTYVVAATGLAAVTGPAVVFALCHATHPFSVDMVRPARLRVIPYATTACPVGGLVTFAVGVVEGNAT